MLSPNATYFVSSGSQAMRSFAMPAAISRSTIAASRTVNVVVSASPANAAGSTSRTPSMSMRSTAPDAAAAPLKAPAAMPSTA